MTKQVYGETIKLNKNGEVAKNQYTKLIYAIRSQIGSKIREWEFIAGVDGMQSERAQALQCEIDVLKKELENSPKVF